MYITHELQGSRRRVTSAALMQLNLLFLTLRTAFEPLDMRKISSRENAMGLAGYLMHQSISRFQMAQFPLRRPLMLPYTVSDLQLLRCRIYSMRSHYCVHYLCFWLHFLPL